MKLIVGAVYDGEVLRPDQPLDLEQNQHYQVTIETEPAEAASNSSTTDAAQYPSEKDGMPESIARILEMAEDLGVPDLAEQHDHYLYGVPKR